MEDEKGWLRTEILKGIKEDGSEDWDYRKDGGGKRNKKLAKETKMMNKRNEERMVQVYPLAAGNALRDLSDVEPVSCSGSFFPDGRSVDRTSKHLATLTSNVTLRGERKVKSAYSFRRLHKTIYMVLQQVGDSFLNGVAVQCSLVDIFSQSFPIFVREPTCVTVENLCISVERLVCNDTADPRSTIGASVYVYKLARVKCDSLSMKPQQQYIY
ncbi:hypothetical protein pdam_00018678 [Pocillopora damicornis]|uniref:Uncharacterized protein n=1 Tax=Pocillopora damicornis TaxID=46731 RepID=A0A3M6U0C0_POCDA|nr:hypothetical protein pdam_00018678 [Pocillopora damicornis]